MGAPLFLMKTERAGRARPVPARCRCCRFGSWKCGGCALDAPRIATRQVKWNLQFQKRRGVKIGPARDLPPELERLLVKTSKRVYRLLQLSGFARIDFRLDAEGRPFFLEANPNADIGYGEEFAEAAEAAGIDTNRCLIAFSPSGSGSASSGRKGVAAGAWNPVYPAFRASSSCGMGCHITRLRRWRPTRPGPVNHKRPSFAPRGKRQPILRLFWRSSTGSTTLTSQKSLVRSGSRWVKRRCQRLCVPATIRKAGAPRCIALERGLP